MNSEHLDDLSVVLKKPITRVLLSAGVGISLAVSSYFADGNHAGLGNAAAMNGGSNNNFLNPASEAYVGDDPIGDTTSIDPEKNVTPTPVTFGRGYMGSYGENAKE